MKKIISTIICFTILFGLSTNRVYGAKTTEEKGEKEFIICIDPGHQRKGNTAMEPIAPSSGNMKPRVTSGTAGVATKKAEYVVNLEAALILKELLQTKGYKVIMTRESHDVNISNAERARFANNNLANLVIRIHCDGNSNSSKTGASILIPSKVSKDTKPIYEDSKTYANILSKTLKEDNIKVCGVFEREDITGFNWSKVPVVILEMGFMSNYNEDKMLSDTNYQKKLMENVVKAIEKYEDNH